ncbi:MAG: hypothetical protein WD688_03340 [Candidatus Binatia bacterium]
MTDKKRRIITAPRYLFPFARLGNRQLGEHVFSVDRQSEFLPDFAECGIQHGIVALISLATWKGNLPTVYTAGVSENHHDMQLTVKGSVYRYEHCRIYHC